MRLRSHSLTRIAVYGVFVVVGICVGLVVALVAPDPTHKASAPASRRPILPPLPNDLTAGGPYTGRITCLRSDGRHLVAGGWHMGVYRTADGARWSPVGGDESRNLDVLAVAKSQGTWLAGTFRGKLYALESKVWKLRHDFGGGERSAVRALRVRNGLLLAAAGGTLALSQDKGRTFENLWQGAPINDVIFLNGASARVLFGTLGHGIGACTDLAGACRILPEFRGGKMIAALALNPAPGARALIAAEGDGLYATADGRSFERIEPAGAGAHLRAVYADEQSIAVSVEGQGLWWKMRDRSDWEQIRFPVAITTIARHRGRLFVGTEGAGVFVQSGDRLEGANEGLLNFPDQVVREALEAAGSDEFGKGDEKPK